MPDNRLKVTRRKLNTMRDADKALRENGVRRPAQAIIRSRVIHGRLHRMRIDCDDTIVAREIMGEAVDLGAFRVDISHDPIGKNLIAGGRSCGRLW